jgi:hypothetical protein
MTAQWQIPFPCIEISLDLVLVKNSEKLGALLLLELYNFLLVAPK